MRHPLAAPLRLSSCPLLCETSLFYAHQTNTFSLLRFQHRVLRTATLPLTAVTTSPRPRRSPHQWSHIAHHTRKPGFQHSGIMASDLKTGLAQVRTHMGHSHGHGHHHHDNTYLTSRNKKDPGVRITRIGLYVNLGMAIAKGAGGYAFNSQAYEYPRIRY